MGYLLELVHLNSLLLRLIPSLPGHILLQGLVLLSSLLGLVLELPAASPDPLPAEPRPLTRLCPPELPARRCTLELPAAWPDLPAEACPLTQPHPLELPTEPIILDLPAAWPDLLPTEPCPLTQPCSPEFPIGPCTLESLLLGLIPSLLSLERPDSGYIYM